MNGCPSLWAQLPGHSRLKHLMGWKAGLATQLPRAEVNPQNTTDTEQSWNVNLRMSIRTCIFAWLFTVFTNHGSIVTHHPHWCVSLCLPHCPPPPGLHAHCRGSHCREQHANCQPKHRSEHRFKKKSSLLCSFSNITVKRLHVFSNLISPLKFLHSHWWWQIKKHKFSSSRGHYHFF